MQKLTIYLSLLLFLSTQSLFSQKYSNEFLAIGVGARAHGMSGAQAAIASDVTAAYWNPAGLTEISAPYQAGAASTVCRVVANAGKDRVLRSSGRPRLGSCLVSDGGNRTITGPA